MTTQDALNIVDYFLSDERLKEIGSRRAVEFLGRDYSYQEVRREVDRWAEELRGEGVKEGDRVAVWLYDTPEFIACLLATMSLGAISVPINTYLNRAEVDFILADSEASVLVAEQELIEKLMQTESDNLGAEKVSLIVIAESGQGRVRQRSRTGGDRREEGNRSEMNQGAPSVAISESSSGGANRPVSLRGNSSTTKQTPAILLYTSGSTGMPKGALHLQGNIVATVEGFGKQILRLAPSDRVFSASRLYFAYGLGNSFSLPFAAGATVILTSARPTPQMIADIFRRNRPTVFFAVPAVYRALLDLHAKD